VLRTTNNHLIKLKKKEPSEDLRVVLDYFDRYPLITHKLGDYKLFKQAFHIMDNKEHLTIEGIKALVGIKAKLN